MRKMGIGLQMYTLRDETAKDFVGTLHKVAAIGYEGVEFAGYGGLSADELRALLDELGIKAVGSHVDINRVKNNIDEVIAFEKTIGSSYVVVPFMPEEFRNTSEAWQETLALFDEAGKRFAEQGLVFGYHNHSFEFEQNIGDELLFDALFSGTDNAAVKVELDVCWVQNGGQDPLAYLNKYKGRVPLVHFKDLHIDADGKALTMPLGEGDIDLESVLAASSESGTEWLIVEQDQCQYDPIESITNSCKWLQTHMQ